MSALCLMLYRGSELLDQYEAGKFNPLSPAGLMRELKLIIENIDLPADRHCLFRSNHVSNYVQLAATLPHDKQRLLRDIDYSIAQLSKLKSWDVIYYNLILILHLSGADEDEKKLASVLTVIMLACSLPCQAQAAAPIVSNKPHKAPVATPPAVSKAQPVRAVPEHAAVKADAAAKPAAEVKAPKQAKPEKKAKKTAKKKSKKTKEKQSKVQVQQSNWRLKVAQQKLQVLGFSDERPSGRMTEATSTALKSFQKQHKLKADGELNDATYQKLTWEAFAKEGIPKVKGKEIVSRAAKYKGVPYVFGGTTTKGLTAPVTCSMCLRTARPSCRDWQTSRRYRGFL